MVNYRRNFQAGGTYFFTVTLLNRKADTLVRYIEELLTAIHQVKGKYPFKMKAYVILPEHLHMIWELPENDFEYAKRWQWIRSLFVKAIQKKGFQINKNKHGEALLWQRRYWEHTIYSEVDYEIHVNYIHYNPVKHGYVENSIDWPFSSMAEYVKRGVLSKDWGSGKPAWEGFNFGE
jgi:putative transposase